MTYLEHLDRLAGQASERLARELVNAWPQIRVVLATAKALSEAHKEWARTLGPGSDAHLVAIARQEFAHRAANRALEGMFAQVPAEEEGVAARPTVVCLCGSSRFGEAFREANLRETLAGRIVLTIGCDTKSDDAIGLGSEVKPMLDQLHLRKIDLADQVLILNVGGYVGESTRRELAYATVRGKVVRWLEEESDG